MLLQNIKITFLWSVIVFILLGCNLFKKNNLKKEVNKNSNFQTDTFRLPNHVNQVYLSQWDSLNEQKVKKYQYIKDYYFLFKNEDINDSTLFSLYDTGFKVDEDLIDKQNQIYSEKIWKLQKENKEAWDYYRNILKKGPFLFEVDSTGNVLFAG